MGVWVYGCTGVRVYGCTGVWVYGCTGVRVYETVCVLCKVACGCVEWLNALEI
jgi:hypothetical protein